MKKLMMSAVLLLPLIVLMILLVSGTIIGRTTHLYVEALSFSNPETLVLVMDDENNPPSEQLEVSVNPSAATNKQLKYSSADESVVTISDTGIVTAVDYGKTSITVTSVENEAVSITRDVLVTDNKIHRVEFKEDYPTRIYNSIGNNPQLSVNVFPNVYDDSVGTPFYIFEFKSSDSNVLYVAQNGTLTPLGAGEATITVSLKDDPSVKPVATKTIKVINPLESVTFVKSGDGAAVTISSDEAVFPAVQLNSGADEKISYTSSNPSIATVDETGHICFSRAGRVSITATASDELGNVKSVSKEYTCTKDYYLGNLFLQSDYTVDFDEVMATRGGILPITISENPNGAKQEIIEVTFSRDGVITFDYENKKFALVGNEDEIGEVRVAIRARKYSSESDTIEEFDTDECLINIERNVKSIEVNFDKEINYPMVNIMEDFADYITVSPAVHTNKFRYEVMSGDATVDADGILRFTSPSTVTVQITAINETPNPASASITFVYGKVEAGDKRLDYYGAENNEEYLDLKIFADDNKEKGIVVFRSLPEGVEIDSISYAITLGEGTVLALETDGDTVKIVPLKGGYGTVVITANVAGASSRATNTWVVNVYVDRQINEVILTPNVDVTTSLTSCPYTVEVRPADAMAGKELHITGAEDRITTAATYNGRVEFSAQGGKDIRAYVSYAGESAAITGTTVKRTIYSTFGTLSEYPTITRKDTGKELSIDGPNEFTLNNIGEKIQLEIDTSSFAPSDYVLKASDVSVIVNTQYISYTISDDGATVTLIGVNGCKDESVIITVTNKTFYLTGAVIAKADYLKVSYGNINFTSGIGNYVTFVDTLTFKVTPTRRDQKDVTEGETLHWTYGAIGADSATGDVIVTLGNSNNANANSITFTYGELTFVVNVQKVSTIDDFGIQASYTDGGEKKLSPIESIANQKDEIYYKFPSSIQNQFTLQIILPDNVIGGFGKDDTANGLFARTFKISGFGDWQVTHDPYAAQITLIATTKTERAININQGSLYQNITFMFVDINNIESLGFSMKKEDVYLGYQQVRVFAKHSYYNGEAVSYFKIPLEVEGTLRYLNFKIERYVNNAQQYVITTQDGYTVIYGGTTYTIRKISENGAEYGLFDASGNNVSDSGITWVDVFSEPGFARIYFGNFAGLRESDVYNDYFGNYGEKSDWQLYAKAVDDGSGRAIDISENNSGAFMRIEANDGIEGSNVSWHYNFNVLDDNVEDELDAYGNVKCKRLVNIETAADYLARPDGRVVLQHSLYGRGERKDDKDDKYTLELPLKIDSCADKGSNKYTIAFADMDRLQKELIYGNGFQVNFETYNRQAMNAFAGNPEVKEIPANSNYPNKKVISNGENNLFLGSLYNVTIKGANIDEQGRNSTDIYDTNLSLWLWDNTCIYYSNIMAFRKGLDIWGGHTAYVKNVTMRYMPEFAIKVNNDSTAYIENIVIAESRIAIRSSGDNPAPNHNAVIYFKGYQDIFCYSVPDDILNALVTDQTLISLAKLLKVMDGPLQDVCEYSEWFGNNGGTAIDDYRYINLAILCENDKAAERPMYFWNGSEYETRLNTPNPGELRQGAAKNFGLGKVGVRMAIWSYDVLNSVDGGKATKTSAIRKDNNYDGWGKLFTDERYIRLLCEYKTKDSNSGLVSNGEHLQWHFNRAYRDSSLVGADGWHLDTHTTNLQRSLIGVTWMDAGKKDVFYANDYIDPAILNLAN